MDVPAIASPALLAPTDDVSLCIRAFVEAAVRGLRPQAESYVEGYFGYRDSAAAERLVATVMRGMEALMTEEGARTFGITQAQWRAFNALAWRDD